MLIVFSLLVMASFSAMSVVSSAVQDGKIPDDIIGINAILLTVSYIASIIIAYRYAGKNGRRAGLYALGAFLLPGIIPFILSCLPENSPGVDLSNSGDTGYTGVPKEESRALGNHFRSMPSSDPQFRQWHLDRLRLFCIVMPFSGTWRVVSTTTEYSFIFPDLLPPEDESSIYEFLDSLSANGKANQSSEIKLCLANLGEPGSLIDLRKIKSRTELLAGLYHFREHRRKALNEWLETNPRITLRGGLGASAILDKNGYHGKRRELSWPEVSKIKTETMNGLVTHMYVLPENHSGGLFDLGKGKYALGNIPTSKTALYVAEVQFWKNFSLPFI